MMNDEPLIRISDKIMPNGYYSEVARKFGRRIDISRRWGKNLDHDDRVGDFESRIGHLLSAVDEGIGLVGGVIIDAHCHAVGQHMTGQSGSFNRSLQCVL